MVGQNVRVGHALLKGALSCNGIEHTCDFFGALGTKVLVWGGFVAVKTNFCFERHVWTSAKNDTP